jgi:hypothetical protein
MHMMPPGEIRHIGWRLIHATSEKAGVLGNSISEGNVDNFSWQAYTSKGRPGAAPVVAR